MPYTPGMSDVITQLPVDQIHDIYFSDNRFGSARALDLLPENLEELYNIRKQYGIKLHYLINGNHYTNEFYEQTHEIIEHVKLLDVDVLTMNNTYLMRDPGFMQLLRQATGRTLEIKNSVNNKPKTLKEVMFLVETLSIGHVIVDRALNRNLDELKKISAYCKERSVKITMLVNEGCIVDCMWKNFDDMMISQTTKDSNMKIINIVHDKLGCTDYFEQKAGEYLKTGFTLPNDLNKFNGLIDIVKIAGRNNPVSKWLAMCKSYMYETGNEPIRTLFSTKPPNILLNITANQLADANFNVITENCKNVCGTECTLCDNILEKIIPKV